MQYTSRGMNLRWQALLLVCVTGVALLAIFKSSAAAPAASGPEPQQDVIRLETRINQLEQRLYSIETSIRTLEQQSRISGAMSRSGSVTPEDVAQLRSQIQALQLRLAEDECGLARLDERTLSPTMRDARRKSAGRIDPCRTNVESPLRLPENRR